MKRRDFLKLSIAVPGAALLGKYSKGEDIQFFNSPEGWGRVEGLAFDEGVVELSQDTDIPPLLGKILGEMKPGWIKEIALMNGDDVVFSTDFSAGERRVQVGDTAQVDATFWAVLEDVEFNRVGILSDDDKVVFYQDLEQKWTIPAGTSFDLGLTVQVTS